MGVKKKEREQKSIKITIDVRNGITVKLGKEGYLKCIVGWKKIQRKRRVERDDRKGGENKNATKAAKK